MNDLTSNETLLLAAALLRQGASIILRKDGDLDQAIIIATNAINRLKPLCQAQISFPDPKPDHTAPPPTPVKMTPAKARQRPGPMAMKPDRAPRECFRHYEPHTEKCDACAPAIRTRCIKWTERDIKQATT